jgi:hypothetical protein
MSSTILTHYKELKELKKIKPDSFDNTNYDTVLNYIKNYLNITRISTKLHFYTNYYILSKLLKLSDLNIEILIIFFEKRDYFL